jgi:hypothetical protein
MKKWCLPFTGYDFLCLWRKHCSKKAAQGSGREAQGKNTKMTKISALCLMPCALSHVFIGYLLVKTRLPLLLYKPFLDKTDFPERITQA